MSAPDHTSSRVRLFENEHLEKLTLIAPRTFAIVWSVLLPIVAWVGLGTAGVPAGLGLIAAGYVVWTLFEYAMHRYLFHLKMDRRIIRWFVFVIHGNHHDRSNDRLRDLMPLSVSLPVLSLVWAMCLAVLGAAGTWAFLGFAIGYVVYDTVHFACHQWPMRGRFASALKRHHMRHHHVDDARNFAISAIFWDVVFGTRVASLKQAKQVTSH